MILLLLLHLFLQSGGKAQPTSASEFASRARAAAGEQHWQEAIDDYRQAISLEPGDKSLRTGLGDVLLQTNQVTEAIAAYQEALQIDSRNLAAQLGLAQAFRRVYNYGEAERILARTRREYPRSVAAWEAQGNLNLELQRYEAAVNCLVMALRYSPRDLKVRNELAVAFKAKGEPARALEQLQIVLRRDAHNALASYLRASIHADRNENQEALGDAEESVAAQPTNYEARVLLGKLLVRVSQCRRAVSTLEPLAAEQPQDSEALFLLSHAYECAGDSARAKEALGRFTAASQRDRATKENQTQADHLVEQANALARKNQFAPALDLLTKALDKEPENPAAYAQLAKIYFSMGQVEKADDAIGHALAVRPYHSDYLYVKGKVLEAKGKMEEALNAFRDTALVNPREADAYFEMGVIYQKRGDLDEARAAFAKAVRLTPNDMEYRRALETAQPPPRQ